MTKDWNDNEACLTLQGLLYTTNWEMLMFIESSADIDELTDAVTSWLTYCESTVIPPKNFRVYPNSKPWVSRSLKTLLDKKNKAFKERNVTELHNLQKEIKREVRTGKTRYKDKIEAQLKLKNLGSAWEGMKTITGLKERDKIKVSLDT